ncbi:MFS general substrate transporter [Annulohypoxylon truncatum]|uniref:MFS general substrate transporter n=1 Tax=Annulohypoxylon truncatum TaxID=327061 RepID=UPI0020082817|nr:MFS general substrate transporter [Annulohypoxylon truncatum]KAI1205872.1 MFS general substrate transporter [Annulohypoxylon truncatum]
MSCTEGRDADLELQEQPQILVTHNEVSLERGPSQELKPVDGGRDAWTVLIGGLIFEAFFWGYPVCFGVFQNYYTNQPEFRDSSSDIALIGTLAQGLASLGAPFSAMLTKRFPKYQQHLIWIGWPVTIGGLVAASFSTSVGGLIGTQGVMYGVGFVILSYPIINMINEWWVARKGMAFGLISASSGVTGAFLPFLIEYLLNKYGWRTTLRISAVALAMLTGPLVPLFKPRLPPSESAVLAKTNWAFLKRPLFWIYALAILIQGLGFYFPSVFLPSYAASVGIPAVSGASLLALMSVAQVLGQFAFGYLSDKTLPVSLLTIVCCVAASLASLTFWGLGKSVALLAVFSLLYGFFGYGFSTMRVAMGRAVSDDPSIVVSTYSIFVFLQGIGNILVGPLSSALMTPSTERGHFAAGKYGGVVILTSSSYFLAALVIGGWHGYQRLFSTITR